MLSPRALLLAVLVVLGAAPLSAQPLPDPTEPNVPPPLPPAERPADDEAGAEPEPKPEDELAIASDRPWGLPPALLESLAARTEAYREFATWFTSNETTRNATYDGAGEASKEEVRRYAYLLERDGSGANLRESRQRIGAEGEVKSGEVNDETVFPPAYGWVFLFSRFHQPFFAYRDLGESFDGFHHVRTIQFRGALPFTDGRDIRQWEGIAVVDASTSTPIRVLAEPSAQRQRIEAMFDRWTRAFNIVGFRLAPRPFGFRCRVEFGLQRESLTFPTELRYDTFRAIHRRQTVPIAASIRNYGDYRFFKTETQEEVEAPRGGP